MSEVVEADRFGQAGSADGYATGWLVERTNSWHNAHKKLVWCTERQGRVIDFWVAFSEVVIIVRRLIREAWVRYRWETRPDLLADHDLLAEALSSPRGHRLLRLISLKSSRLPGDALRFFF